VSLVTDLAVTLFADEASNPKNVAILVGVVATGYSLPLWWLSRRSLHMIALIVSAYALLVALVFPDPEGFFLGIPDITAVAVVTWFFGGALVAAGMFGVLVPRKTTIVLGSIASIGGPLLLLVNENDVLGELLSFATAAALVIVGTWREELAATGLGIVGLLVASAIIVGDHVKDQGPAIVVLVIGLLLLGGAIMASRATPGQPGSAAPTMPEATPPP